MAMRAQVSLVFRDANLYQNLIEPAKASKELHGIILRCLSAYYYDEEVRNRVEGVSDGDLIEEVESVHSSQDHINGLRDMLAMQNVLAAELEQTVANGAEDINDLLNKTNEKAESYSWVKASETEYGQKTYLVDRSEMQKVSEAAISAESAKVASGNISDIPASEKMDMLFAFMLRSPEFMNFISSGGSAEPVNTEVVNETSMSSAGSEVLTNEVGKVRDLDMSGMNMAEEFKEEPVEESVLGEASDSLAELFNSLSKG